MYVVKADKMQHTVHSIIIILWGNDMLFVINVELTLRITNKKTSFGFEMIAPLKE